MNILLFFCVFTFRVDYEMYSFVDMEIFLMESTFILNELQIVPSFPRQKYFSFPTKDTFHSQHEK